MSLSLLSRPQYHLIAMVTIFPKTSHTHIYINNSPEHLSLEQRLQRVKMKR